MREVLGLALISLCFLSSCYQGGYHPTYIISEHAKEQTPPKEEAR